MAQASEKRHWDAFWAASQDLDDVYANDDRIGEFLGERMNFEGMRILEVGAGTGRDSGKLAALGAEVWTLDYSEESLHLMSEHLDSELEIVCGDALALPFYTGSFDLVFHQGLLEHFRKPSQLLDENFRILKSGGVMLVDVPQRFHYYTLAKHILMFFDKWFAGWETEFSVSELQSLVRGSGFTVEANYGRNLFPPIWYRAMRKVCLKSGIRLPMYPLQSPSMIGLRKSVLRAVPDALHMNTAMVIGCLGRKP